MTPGQGFVHNPVAWYSQRGISAAMEGTPELSKQEKSAVLTSWGTSLLNKLPADVRNKRKRDASKRRRRNDGASVLDGVEGSPAGGHPEDREPGG